MTNVQCIFFVIAVLILGYWIYFIQLAVLFDQIVRKFSKEIKWLGPFPKVSVVIPARNEGENVEACLRGLQDQTYSNLEVILVNDRSEDNTGIVMQKYASANSTWQYIEIKTLPDGWIGKNHALHLGGKKATGEYIVFSDGDVVYSPHAVTRAISSVLIHDLDLLGLSATMNTKDVILSAMQALFTVGMISLLKLHKLGKSPKRYIGVGVFNLVKTSLYRKMGGHESIRLEMIDDLMLGKMMVQAGAKPGFMDGRDLISVAWYPTWKAMIFGLEKNGFASVRFSVSRMILFLTVMYGVYLFPYFGVFLFPSPTNYLFGASLVIAHLVMAEIGKRTGNSPWVTFLLPIAAILIGFAFIRSGILTMIRGQVTWRDTSYPLKLLRETTKL